MSPAKGFVGRSRRLLDLGGVEPVLKGLYHWLIPGAASWDEVLGFDLYPPAYPWPAIFVSLMQDPRCWPLTPHLVVPCLLTPHQNLREEGFASLVSTEAGGEGRVGYSSLQSPLCQDHTVGKGHFSQRLEVPLWGGDRSWNPNSTCGPAWLRRQRGTPWVGPGAQPMGVLPSSELP